jgi:hypothetical protein
LGIEAAASRGCRPSGESGASLLKGGGALQEIARAFFVRSKSTTSSAILVSSTAA